MELILGFLFSPFPPSTPTYTVSFQSPRVTGLPLAVCQHGAPEKAAQAAGPVTAAEMYF